MAMASVKQSLRETIDRGSVLKGCWWAGPLIHRKQFLIWKILGGPRPSLVPTKLRQWPHGNYIRQVYSSNICDGRSSKSRLQKCLGVDPARLLLDRWHAGCSHAGWLELLVYARAEWWLCAYCRIARPVVVYSLRFKI
jgi:hypothetical protein